MQEVDGQHPNGLVLQGSVVRRRTKEAEHQDTASSISANVDSFEVTEQQCKVSWKRIMLMIVAITVHNIPGLSNTERHLCEVMP